MVDESLMEGEEVVFATEKHWMAPVADSVTAVLLLIGAAVLAWLQTGQTDGIMGFVNRLMELARLGLLFVAIAMIIFNVINWRVAWVKVTNFRVLGHEGLIRSRNTDSLLQSISDVRTRSSFFGGRLKYGDITLYSASGEAGADKFTTMKDIETLKKRILEQKTRLAGTFASAVGAAAGAGEAANRAPAPPNQTDTMAALASLGQLRDSGVITPEEFEAKKQDLLSRI